MRYSLVIYYLLLLSLLLSQAQGIRLEKWFKSVMHQEIHEEMRTSLIKTTNGGVGEVIHCKEGQCTGTMKNRVSRASKKSHHWLPDIHEDYYGPRNHKPMHRKNRKLITATTSTSTTTTTTSKNDKNGDNKANPTSKGKSDKEEIGGEQENFTANSLPTTENYEDLREVELDYSPPKTKPPIHNLSVGRKP